MCYTSLIFRSIVAPNTQYKYFSTNTSGVQVFLLDTHSYFRNLQQAFQFIQALAEFLEGDGEWLTAGHIDAGALQQRLPRRALRRQDQPRGHVGTPDPGADAAPGRPMRRS